MEGMAKRWLRAIFRHCPGSVGILAGGRDCEAAAEAILRELARSHLVERWRCAEADPTDPVPRLSAGAALIEDAAAEPARAADCLRANRGKRVLWVESSFCDMLAEAPEVLEETEYFFFVCGEKDGRIGSGRWDDEAMRLLGEKGMRYYAKVGKGCEAAWCRNRALEQ